MPTEPAYNCGSDQRISGTSGRSRPARDRETTLEYQIGEIGKVGVQVIATQAAEPQRTALPTGCDVGGLFAQTVGSGDLADRPPHVLGIQQYLGLAPPTVAVPVELQSNDPVHGLTATPLADL
ncbi:hypothetical protein ACFXP3_13680 [Streptomyces sp. NPDC059096]|uniref:hypothetical protein n=1 Tax=Streptomyces sp. NPDC059096 TaxID=3346727 RepID=UPI00367403BF